MQLIMHAPFSGRYCLGFGTHTHGLASIPPHQLQSGHLLAPLTRTGGGPVSCTCVQLSVCGSKVVHALGEYSRSSTASPRPLQRTAGACHTPTYVDQHTNAVPPVATAEPGC